MGLIREAFRRFEQTQPKKTTGRKANFTTFLTVSPSAAFDALLFVNTLTPARHAPRAQ
jgi:hypothetical protein